MVDFNKHLKKPTKTELKNRAIQICREIIGDPDKYVIVDTETTGLPRGNELMEIAVIDPKGNVLLNEFREPTCNRHPKAIAVNGLTTEKLIAKGARPWGEWWEDLESTLAQRAMVIYNASYDEGIIEDTAKVEGTRNPIASDNKSTCIMRLYSDFLGVSRWQPLEGGDHTAVGDCQATLLRILEMANTPFAEEPAERDITTIVNELTERANAMNQAKKEADALKAELIAAVQSRGVDAVELPDGRIVGLQSNIVKLKPTVAEIDIPEMFKAETWSRAAVVEAIQKGDMHENYISKFFEWDYSSLVKVAKPKPVKK